ncbi:60 kDa chaperonin 3 [Arthrobacter sp. Hiyo4]|nr:60 kDa chaperonin 3 [Arthrobacter sp. Hiyo4]
MIADALGAVGPTGVVEIEEFDEPGIRMDIVDGIEIDHGFISPYMVTDRERMEASLDDPLVLLTNRKITQVQELMPTVEAARRANRPWSSWPRTSTGRPCR